MGGEGDGGGLKGGKYNWIFSFPILFATPLTHHHPPPLPLNPIQDICGALTYINGLVILTAKLTLAVGPYEEQRNKLPVNDLSKD